MPLSRRQFNRALVATLVAGAWPTARAARTPPAKSTAMALVEGRDPFPNAVQSANWTCVGLCAHESAMKGGAIVKLPAFTQWV